jgi:hypothetical protein
MHSILKRLLSKWMVLLCLVVGSSLLMFQLIVGRLDAEAVSAVMAPIDPFAYYFPFIAKAPGPPPPTLSTYDWPQFGLDPMHSGSDNMETWITPGDVAGLHKLFQISLPSIADGAPAFLAGVATNSGTRDLVFVTTKAGHIIALDAHTGLTIWSHQNNGVNYTTSSPAIDPNRQFIYSYGLDGKAHKYAVGDGKETIGSGWPETATLKPSVEKGSSALSIATTQNITSFLYVANGGYPGDAGDYQGHVTAINLADGTQKVFNANCSNQTVHFAFSPAVPSCGAVQTAIWARPGVVYDPYTDKIYMSTGNGSFAPVSHDWGETVFALNPDGTGLSGNPIDTWTPVNFQQLTNGDVDLGSTAPAILPPSPGKYSRLGVQSGKDGVVRLLNMDNLSGQGGAGHTGGEVFSTSMPNGGGVYTAAAVWVNPIDNTTWVFIANGYDSGIAGFQLVIDGLGNPSLQTRWAHAGGTSPIVANGVLFYAKSGSIHAVSPQSGIDLWFDIQIGGIHWESPIVASGILYITDESAHLTAYSR